MEPTSTSSFSQNNSANQINATYTISAPTSSSSSSSISTSSALASSASSPPSSGQRLFDDNNDDDDDDKIVATYTISSPSQPPPSSNVSFNAIIPTATSRHINESKEKVNPVESFGTETVTVLPSSNIHNHKTDLETLTKTASPTIAQATFKYDQHRQNTDEPSRDVHASATVDFIQRNSSKDNKRSLFDLDNASSLSLAEKLRNEANKYSESSTETTTTSPPPSSTTDTSGSTSSNKDALDDDNETTTTTIVSSPQHHQPERRPSWRLKFDAGCKVRKIFTITIVISKKKIKKLYSDSMYFIIHFKFYIFKIKKKIP